MYILQYRTDASGAHERACFENELARYRERLVFVDMIGSDFSAADLADPAAIIIGGSGQLYLSRQRPADKELTLTKSIIAYALEHDVPLLGICYGMQVLGSFCGARIVDEPRFRETGTLELTKLPSGGLDPLFSRLPDTFMASLGHKEALVDIPEDVLTPLARSERVDCQAFRVKRKPAWGVLFHAELTIESLKDRIRIYPDYAADPEGLERLFAGFSKTPEANDFLRFFAAYALEGELEGRIGERSIHMAY